MLTDFRGTEIKVGSTIVYHVKGSTSISSHEARVEAITEKPHPWSQGKSVTHLKVRPTGKTSQSWRSMIGRKHDTVTLTNLKNLVVITTTADAPESLGSHMLGRD